jgi:hypothetical protein
LAIDVSAAGALARRRALQDRLRSVAHGTVDGAGHHTSSERLHREIRSYLLKASDQRLLAELPTDIRRLLLFNGPDRDGRFEIAIGTVRNFNRTKALPHLTRRSDGAWFDFQLTVKEGEGRAEIDFYDFELRLPPGSGFEFVRFDLNPPASADRPGGLPEDGLRSHLHLNADDDGLVVPAPVMSPFEILDLFLHGVRRVGRIRRNPQ